MFSFIILNYEKNNKNFIIKLLWIRNMEEKVMTKGGSFYRE